VEDAGSADELFRDVISDQVDSAEFIKLAIDVRRVDV
jgi:hypothetical protein